MRLIDGDALLAKYDCEHVGEPGKARMLIVNAPKIEPDTDLKLKCEEMKAHIEYLRRQNESMKGEIKALVFAVRCGGVSGDEVKYETD